MCPADEQAKNNESKDLSQKQEALPQNDIPKPEELHPSIQVPVGTSVTYTDTIDVKKHAKGLRGNKKRMILALAEEKGVVKYACKKVGISRETHYRWLAEDPKYKKRYEGLKDEVDDVFEAAFIQMAIDKNPQVVCQAARTRLKHRGYGETTNLKIQGKMEHTGILKLQYVPAPSELPEKKDGSRV